MIEDEFLPLILEQGAVKIKDDQKVTTNFPFILPDFMTRCVYTSLYKRKAEPSDCILAYGTHRWLLDFVNDRLLEHALNDELYENTLKVFVLLQYLHHNQSDDILIDLVDQLRILYHPEKSYDAFAEMLRESIRFTPFIQICLNVRELNELLSDHLVNKDLPSFAATISCYDYQAIPAMEVPDLQGWLTEQLDIVRVVLENAGSDAERQTLAEEILKSCIKKFHRYAITDSQFFA